MAFYEKTNSRSLEAAVRPGAFDIKGQQVELFPFDAFEFERGASDVVATITLKEPWIFGIKPNQITSSELAENAVDSNALVFGESESSFGTLSHETDESGSVYCLFEDVSGLLSDGSAPLEKVLLPDEDGKVWAGDRTIEFLSNKYWSGWSWVNAGPESDGSITIGLKLFSVDDLINDVEALINEIDELING